MLDFQLCRRARPAIDLVYCLGSSTSPETREEHLEELLQFYHDKLTEILDKYGYKDCYSLSDFKKDFHDCYIFGFVLGTSHAQVE